MVQGGSRAETGRVRGCLPGQEQRNPAELTIPPGARAGGGISKELRRDEDGTWRQCREKMLKRSARAGPGAGTVQATYC